MFNYTEEFENNSYMPCYLSTSPLAAPIHINDLKKFYQGWTAVIMVIECPLQSKLCGATSRLRQVSLREDMLQCLHAPAWRYELVWRL